MFTFNLGISSLQRWAKNIGMRNGILHDVLKIMKINGNTLQNYEKLTVLMFDEMKIATTMEYDQLKDEVVGPHSQMQVVMARGIASKWKQPIFVGFDIKMTKSLLFDIIHNLNDIGFKVICCVSDCGGGNVGLWKQLEITFENPVFVTPSGQRIVHVPDAPHLLKLTRNWLIDTGFTLNELEINKKPLEALISKVTSEVSVCYKLTKEHLTCEGPQRQRVKLATQIFSHTTATALRYYKPIENIQLLDHTAHFIELMNNWFDFANVAHAQDKSTPFKSPYGVFLKEQDTLLDEVYNTINAMRCKGKSSLQIFQKGILMYINGTKYLLKILREHGLQYLLTSKINQDALENLFSQLRSRGGLNDHPSPLNTLHRLRMIILGKNPGIVSTNSNTVDNNQEDYMVAKSLKLANINIKYDENVDKGDYGSDTDTASEDYDPQNINDHQNENEMAIDGIEYLAGWVAKKFKLTFPEIGCTTTELNKKKSLPDHDYIMPSWINHLSYGGLITPSNDFRNIIIRVERLFNKFTKHEVPKGPNVVSKLTNKIFSRMMVDEKFKRVIKVYIKQRVIIRMKYSNYHMRSLKLQKNKTRLNKLNKLRKLMT